MGPRETQCETCRNEIERTKAKVCGANFCVENLETKSCVDFLRSECFNGACNDSALPVSCAPTMDRNREL